MTLSSLTPGTKHPGTQHPGTTRRGTRTLSSTVDHSPEQGPLEQRPLEQRPVDLDAGLPDVEAASHHARAFLEALGIDVTSPARRKSPLRMAKAYLEMMSSDPFEMTTFDNDEDYSELVLVTSIPVQSLCEHHFLPFTGVAHVGYLPGERLVGLSKLARTVEAFARRPQTQEHLTRQIADTLHAELAARGVGVVIEAEHTCMSLRGVRTAGAATRTSSFTGDMADAAARTEFLQSLP